MRNIRTTPLLLILLAMTLSAGKCGKTADTAALAQQIGQGRWLLSEINGKAITVPEGVETPYLELDASNGSVSGFGGCNRLMGTVELAGDKIGFPGLGSTKRLCEQSMDLENRFTGALRNVSSFKLDGGKLDLTDGTRSLLKLVQAK